MIGTPTFPNGDTAAGGNGQTVDGLTCGSGVEGGVPYHHHIHIALFNNNQQIAIPLAVGMVPPWTIVNGFASSPKCKYNIHTHDMTGVVHLEFAVAPTTEPQLAEVFDVWGEPLSSTNVAGYTGTVTVFVNGVRYPYDIRAMGIGQNYMQITLEVNSNVPPPVYNFATY